MPYSRIQYLCWLFSGAEISLLKECPTDYNRQASIGFTILMTCLFAGMAGGFAAWRFSEGSILAAGIFGLVWAMLIFSIDRSMVVTLKKDPTKPKGGWGKVIAFSARMVLAGLLAFLISLPLETYIFHVQIDNELSHQNTASQDSLQKELERIYGKPQLVAERTEVEGKIAGAQANQNNYDPPSGDFKAANLTVQRITNEIAGLDRDIAINEKIAADAFRVVPYIRYTYYVDGEPRQASKLNKQSDAWQRYKQATGTATNLRRAKRARMGDQSGAIATRETIRKKYFDDNKDLIARLEAEAKTKKIQLDSAIAKIDHQIAIELPKRVRGGFVREFTALEDASRGNTGLFLMLWLIRAMFFIIELLPTIVKMVTPIGEYDRQLHAHEELFALALRTNYSIMEGRERLRQQTEQRIAEQLEQARLDRELELGKNVLEKTATYQNDLAERMLRDWHKQEREKQKAAAIPRAPANPPVAVYTPSMTQQTPVVAPKSAPTVPTQNAQPAVAPATPVASVTSPPIVAVPVQAAQSTAVSAASTITLAALTSKQFWWLKPDNRRNWYAFENGSTNNRVRRKINGGDIENGRWEHPNDDKSLLRITFNTETEEYNIQRLTNTEMVLRNAASDEELSFLA
ncbi:DUF4407 domain-containing protein [Hymenobacter latericus]|uniref:DUF4407 domain-containing protein n=1 Tax=Hymenobacter sp. YIM 151858-1 TaxID=2987688 RepID=UPI0022272B4D|nr:DUF4407 domain-containing protein [Hymenobacter sp. YIM 151858-1]UYZ58056.1 DUF4407 domain-containing protein [Hymenobacter sp. YIM 151858-1]